MYIVFVWYIEPIEGIEDKHFVIKAMVVKPKEIFLNYILMVFIGNVIGYTKNLFSDNGSFTWLQQWKKYFIILYNCILVL